MAKAKVIHILEVFLALTVLANQLMTFSFGSDDVFEELHLAQECFPTKISNTTPECKFFVSQNATSELTSNCIRNTRSKTPALHILGEFHILKITCTALFPIDFRYHGIQPTEAILVEWYKKIQSGKRNQKFTVEIKVFSVQALFDFYNNPNNSYYQNPEGFLSLQTVHNYSRTGSYEFYGIFNGNLGTSFYLFLEDSVKPSFLRNQKTYPKISESNFVLPCASSHFDSKVELTNQPLTTSQFVIKSPLDGFIFKIIDNDVKRFFGNYKCKLIHNSMEVDTIDFTFDNVTSVSAKNFGLENHDYKGGDLDVSGVPIFEGEYVKYIEPFCKTGSPSDKVDLAQLKLISIPVHNFGYMRLVQQFVLPKYFNQSYTARMVNNVTGEWRTLTRRIKQPYGTNLKTGTAYCTTGYSQKIVDYGSSLRGLVNAFDYGEDWATFDRKTNDIKTHFGLDLLNKSFPLYAGKIIAFECRINIPVVVKPVVWYTERGDGTRVEEKIDYDLVGDIATWYANFTVDVRKVICSASYWYADWWREISLNITLQEITKPVINNDVTTKTFQPGSQGATLECLAWGNPKPNVYFEKDGLRLFSLESENGTVLIFKRIDNSNIGKYTCVANNGIETRRDFFINVESNDFGILLTIAIPLLVFVLTVSVFSIYIKCFRSKKKGLTKEEIEEFLQGMKKEQIAKEDENYAHGFATMNPYAKEYEVDPDRFVIYEKKVLGRGAFGIVTMGTVDDKPVAVKTTQKNAEKQYLKALLSELKIMIYLGSHPNLVKIIGAYTKDLVKGIVYIFVEYVDLGNLGDYLRKNRSVPTLTTPTDVSTLKGYVTFAEFIGDDHEYKNVTGFNEKQLLLWAKQIADGMEYLEFKKVIHGDLATRNVLLDGKLNVKITDFGLSRQLYDYHDYVKKQQALESLKYMTFSSASDVWAFGITVWEIFTLGELPYPGFTWSLDFVDELGRGLRLGKPRYGSEQLFSIIGKCWHEEPKNRPNFKILQKQLGEILTDCT